MTHFLSHSFQPIRRGDYWKNVFEPIYSLAMESIHPHQLAVFFALVANGLLTELTAEAEKLNILSKACVAFAPVLFESTSWAVLALWLITYMDYTSQHSDTLWLGIGFACRVASIVISFHYHYLMLCSHDAAHYRLVWVCSFADQFSTPSLIKDLSTDRNDSNLCSDEEVQRRRIIFWELFYSELVIVCHHCLIVAR
jgi:hypothetical protein